MDQRIFNLNLSVEATSLYLLMVALADGGTHLVRENILPLWNASPPELEAAFQELKQRGVAGEGAAGDWFLRPAEEWEQPAD